MKDKRIKKESGDKNKENNDKETGFVQCSE